MSKFKHFILFIIIFFVLQFTSTTYYFSDNKFISYIVNPKVQDLKIYWKNENGDIIKTFQNLINFLKEKNKKLVFAMNGGMFLTDYSPQGLFIENLKTVFPLNKKSGKGNFYMKPNGVFFINSKKEAYICKIENFSKQSNVAYATQSGPMLIADGTINPEFKKGSTSLYIRNGAGILPDGKILFAMSIKEINLYDFAIYFKKNGCKNALYLDGFVSRVYLPEKNWIQLDGEFGVIIGVTEDW